MLNLPLSPFPVRSQLDEVGFAWLPASHWQRPSRGEAEFLEVWDDLPQDTFMGDGGCYRFRRYSRLGWNNGELVVLAGNSICQSLEDNPLNGGVERAFAALPEAVLQGEFLRNLIELEAEGLGIDRLPGWVVGVHCVRIRALSGQLGQPTPEGVHRDAERFTVQHLIARQGVRGGTFSAYDSQRRPRFHWLQLCRWDALVFTGELWHSATPIEALESEGHRDILLIDFDRPVDP